MGGGPLSITRTCTGEVCGRSSRSGWPSTKNVSLEKRDGCPSGALRASKL
jgi:hypothetical protein